MSIKIKPIIGKLSLFVIHEGTKERVIEVHNYDDIQEVRFDLHDGIVKILKKDEKEYFVVLEESKKELVQSFYSTLMSAMSSRMSPEEIRRSNEIREQLKQRNVNAQNTNVKTPPVKKTIKGKN